MSDPWGIGGGDIDDLVQPGDPIREAIRRWCMGSKAESDAMNEEKRQNRDRAYGREQMRQDMLDLIGNRRKWVFGQDVIFFPAIEILQILEKDVREL